MKILYAIQGTGNGHISRAREMVPLYAKYADVDVLISGRQQEVQLDFPIKYKLKGLGYVFGKNGGVDMFKTLGELKFLQFSKDIMQLPVDKYDAVINDYEAVSAFACKFKGVRSIAVSHQCSFYSPHTPRPVKRDVFVEWLLKNYAPPTHGKIGIHFDKYDSFIETPVIRRDVRRLDPINNGHITVYLPAYADKVLIKHMTQVKDVMWEVFSKHTLTPYRVDNVYIKPINSENYLQSLAHSQGLLSGGGFEAPAEGLYLGKKVMVIPMSNQYEQQCNAAAIVPFGVPLIPKIEDDFYAHLQKWVLQPQQVNITYPDNAESIVIKSLEMLEKSETEHAKQSIA